MSLQVTNVLIYLCMWLFCGLDYALFTSKTQQPAFYQNIDCGLHEIKLSWGINVVYQALCYVLGIQRWHSPCPEKNELTYLCPLLSYLGQKLPSLTHGLPVQPAEAIPRPPPRVSDCRSAAELSDTTIEKHFSALSLHPLTYLFLWLLLSAYSF